MKGAPSQTSDNRWFALMPRLGPGAGDRQYTTLGQTNKENETTRKTNAHGLFFRGRINAWRRRMQPRLEHTTSTTRYPSVLRMLRCRYSTSSSLRAVSGMTCPRILHRIKSFFRRTRTSKYLNPSRAIREPQLPGVSYKFAQRYNDRMIFERNCWIAHMLMTLTLHESLDFTN